MIANRMKITPNEFCGEILNFSGSVTSVLKLRTVVRNARRSRWFLLLAIAGGAVLGIIAIKLIALLGAAFDISFLRDVGNNVTSGGAAGGLGAGVGGGAGGPPPGPPSDQDPSLDEPPYGGGAGGGPSGGGGAFESFRGGEGPEPENSPSADPTIGLPNTDNWARRFF